MAFPLDTMHLIAHLRASHLALAEDTDYANRLIKPMKIDEFDGKEKVLFERLEVLESPPISFDIARHIQKSVQNNYPQYRGKKTLRKKIATSPQKKHKRKTESAVKINENNKVEEPSDNLTIDFPFLNEVKEVRADGDSNENQPDISQGINTEVELKHTKTIKGKNKLSKPRFPKLFNHKSTSGNDHDSESSASLETQKSGERILNSIIEEISDKEGSDASDVITIDSDFGVPVTSTGEIVRNPSMYKPDIKSKNDVNNEKSNEIDGYDNNGSKEEALAGKDLYSDEEEEEEEFDDISSSDSAFTDIETDSILNSSILLDSYENDTPSFSFGKMESLSSFKADYKKSRRKKRQNSFEHPGLSKTLSSSNLKGSGQQNMSVNIQRNASGSSQNDGGQKKVYISSRKSQLDFSKINPLSLKQSKKPISHLSDMIHTKFKSPGNNLLSFYSFAHNKNLSDDNVVNLDVFIPPSRESIIKSLKIDNNIAIVDCIGYILLNISKIQDFRGQIENVSFLNPNNWRLELVDEDGENYGSFGILDRSRLLSSYKNLKEVALCKVEDQNEIKKNEIQTPLSLEYKTELQNLEDRQKKLLILNNDSVASINKSYEGRNYELTIVIYPIEGSSNAEVIKHCADPSITVIELINEVCSERGLDPNKYKLRQTQKSENSSLAHKNPKEDNLLQNNHLLLPSANEKHSKSLKDNDNVKNANSDTFELIPANDKSIGGINSVISENSVLNDIITPSDFTFASPFISPRRQLEGKFQSINGEDKKKENIIVSKIPEKPIQLKKNNNSEKYLNDMILGKNLQLPTNLNTIYFKWKVWRKKNTILNKIEKSLIIDGDYIHLTPPDNIAFNTSLDHTFPSESHHHHHHHHHLYYYNYNNYYKQLMMKTSSFHITQITKLKQYKSTKNPNHFKIVITKQVDNPTNSKDNNVKKKYDLEASNSIECQEIIDKLKWVLKVYRSNIY